MTTAETDFIFMQKALVLAARAENEGEVPVGAVLVLGGEVIGEGWNRTVGLNDASAHAEILALRDAGSRTGNYRIPKATLYVSLEPCCMCAGAMIHARIERVVYAATDPKTGAAGSVFDVLVSDRHNHQIVVEGGCASEQSTSLLQTFFKARRSGASRD